jgi:hypothetical protein
VPLALGHGLKAVARHLGLARPDRELIGGDQVYQVFRRELAARGATLLEADTDGVYFAVPGGWHARSHRATTPPSSPIPINCRSSTNRSPRRAPS